jgi:hypothetical protein
MDENVDVDRYPYLSVKMTVASKQLHETIRKIM